MTSIGKAIARHARGGAFLAPIFVLGLVLRLYDVGAESIWVDELSSIQRARWSLPELISDVSQSVHPPLYFVILHYWVSLFGDSEFAARLPSAIFGVLALPAVYLVGERLFSRRAGTSSALILSVSLFHISWSQEARGYTLMVLLALASMYFFIRILESGRRALRVGYVLASCLLIYTHYYGMLVLAAQTAYICLLAASSERPRGVNVSAFLLLQAAVGMSYLPWATLFLRQFLRVQSGYWIPAPTTRSILDSFIEYTGYRRTLLLGLLALASLSVVAWSKVRGRFDWRNALASIGEYAWSVRVLNARENLLLVLWLTVPIAIPFLVSRVSTPIYYTRYTIAASVAFYILAARGIDNIRSTLVRSLAILFVVGVSLASVRDYYVDTWKREWRGAAGYIDRSAKPGDLLLFNDAGESSVFAYYSKRTELITQGFDLEGRLVTEQTPRDEPLGIERLGSAVAGYSRVWLILANTNDRKGLIKKGLQERYRLVDLNRAYQGIEIYLFRREDAGMSRSLPGE